jgi:hypothetical protein
MFGQHEDIGDPGEGGVIGDYARKPDQFLISINAERQRVLDRSSDDFARATGGPVRLIAEIVVNQIEIETRPIGADRIVSALPGRRPPLPLGEGRGEGAKLSSRTLIINLREVEPRAKEEGKVSLR